MTLTVKRGTCTPIHGADVHCWGAHFGGFGVDNSCGELHAETFVETLRHAPIHLGSHLSFATRRPLVHLEDVDGFGCITTINFLANILEHTSDSTAATPPAPKKQIIPNGVYDATTAIPTRSSAGVKLCRTS